MTETLHVKCCIAGGGPAGMMLGFLLARAGIEVAVLEKHGDFLRDFRGDTIHPSTLEVMHELGLLDQFLKRPHQEVPRLGGKIGDRDIVLADFRYLPTHCKFIALMPQWEFLNFLAEAGAHYHGFHLLMETEAESLIEEGGKVRGLRAKGPHGDIEVRADLTVGADGRHSLVRAAAALPLTDLGAPIDVFWMRISKAAGEENQSLGRFVTGAIFVTLDRGDYWQCAYVIPKDGADKLRAQGIEAFRAKLAKIVPDMADRVGELQSWDDVKLLTVTIDRLDRWHKPGLLCIGDAAHAMSPVGGVGINLAIQDAVASANLLWKPLSSGTLEESHLAALQERRTLPTRFIQRMQIFIQNRVITPVLASDRPISPPWFLKLLTIFPTLRRFPARAIGMGIRPEHVQSPAEHGPLS